MVNMLHLMQENEKKSGGPGIWTRDLWHQRQVSYPLDQSFIDEICKKNKLQYVQSQITPNILRGKFKIEKWRNFGSSV